PTHRLCAELVLCGERCRCALIAASGPSGRDGIGECRRRSALGCPAIAVETKVDRSINNAGVVGKAQYEADVVVIGFGGAGACAAIEAHDAGAEVLLLEKQSEENHHPN